MCQHTFFTELKKLNLCQLLFKGIININYVADVKIKNLLCPFDKTLQPLFLIMYFHFHIVPGPHTTITSTMFLSIVSFLMKSKSVLKIMLFPVNLTMPHVIN